MVPFVFRCILLCAKKKHLQGKFLGSLLSIVAFNS